MRNAAADTGGATAVEYALFMGLIAVVLLSAVTSVGTSISALFTKIAASP